MSFSMIAPGLDVNLDHEPNRELHSCDVVTQSDSVGLAVAVSTVVLIALVAETTRLHAEVLEANVRYRRERDHTNLLMSELDHRVKNVLALVSAIAFRTRESSQTMDELVAAINLETAVR
jgi:hypothetical protein